MSAELLFAIATLSGWIGWALLLRSAYLGLRLVANPPGMDRPRTARGAGLAAGLALVGLLLSRFVPSDVGRTIEGSGIKIPVVWFYSHFWGWMILASVLFGGASLIQAYLGITPQERRTKLIWALSWIGLGALAWVIFHRIEGQWTIFRGAFYLQPSTVGILAVLAVAAMLAMAFTARQAKTRSAGKTVWTHLALIVGCLIFGLPFAWLLSSSFKEDKDMAGGIVWIPRVTERVPYLDPKDRQFEGTYQGLTVRATIIEERPDGKLFLDIIQPFSMRGQTFEAPLTELREVPKEVPVVTGELDGQSFRAKVIEEMPNGDRRVQFLSPAELEGKTQSFPRDAVEEVRPAGLRWQNYPDALQYLPPETNFGLVYLQNTLILVVLSVLGTLLSCSIVAYAFSRMQFPGKEFLFKVLLATMMLPGAVTLMPQFLIFKNLGWIDTLLPLWVPTFFAGAFNVFMLRQFFGQIPMELEDAAKIDGCSYFRAFWSVMMPQVKPALAVIMIWTFMGTWNNFMGPLIYINSPENMPIAYALQLFNGDRGGEPALLMAFATLTMLPVLALFFFAQKYFIEGVTLSGLGGR